MGLRLQSRLTEAPARRRERNSVASAKPLVR